MIYLLFPVYNEALNMENLSADVHKIASRHDIKVIFVNDGSTDNTVEAIREHFEDLNTALISMPKNCGPGTAFNEGFKKIIEEEKDQDSMIVTMEADATSDVDVLDKMIAISRLDFDLVLASVYAQGGGFQKTSAFRLLLSRTANTLIKMMYGIRVNTYTSFYRVYKLKTLREIATLNDGEVTRERGFICKLDILISAIKTNASLIEVPVELLTLRRKGRSKMKIARTMMEYLRFFYRSLLH